MSISLRPDKLDVGQVAHVEAAALATTGAHYSLTGSSQLALNVDPASIAKTDSDGVVAAPGKAEVQAAFAALKAAAPLEVAPPVAAAGAKLVVKPLQAKLTVGERLRLDVLAPGSEPLDAVSADPKIVQVANAKELLGQGEGSTEVAHFARCAAADRQGSRRSGAGRIAAIQPAALDTPGWFDDEVARDRHVGRRPRDRRRSLAALLVETAAGLERRLRPAGADSDRPGPERRDPIAGSAIQGLTGPGRRESARRPEAGPAGRRFSGPSADFGSRARGAANRCVRYRGRRHSAPCDGAPCHGASVGRRAGAWAGGRPGGCRGTANHRGRPVLGRRPGLS